MRFLCFFVLITLLCCPPTSAATGGGLGVIAVGYRDFCGVTVEGGVKCWGENFGGQLGNGTTTKSAQPVNVKGLDSHIIGVAAGSGTNCALSDAGAVMCWGANFAGELGNGSSDKYSTVPVPVTGLSSAVISLALGADHACALMNEGTVRCWGSNNLGQIGTAASGSSGVPVTVTGLPDKVVALSAGGYHTCAITASGSTLCWGSNMFGELGSGSSERFSSVPKPVVGLTSGATAISAGRFHTCALNAIGAALCWGRNTSHGALGNGSTEDSNRPVGVYGLINGVVAISAGDTFACAITSRLQTLCWGSNFTGELGNGEFVDHQVFSRTPVAVAGPMTGAVAVVAGWDVACALMPDGTVRSWGGTFDAPSVPAVVANATIKTTGVSGVIRLKYRVLQVFYAPPGARSTVTYGSNYAAGTSTSFSQSFSTTSSISASVRYGTPSDNLSMTSSSSWVNESSSSDAVSMTSTRSESIVIPGPGSSALGVDHSKDVLWIWLNPSLTVSALPVGTSAPISVDRVNFDARDPVGDVDVIPLTVAQLEIIQQGGKLPDNVQIRLNRTWSTTGPIDANDAGVILATDPFVSDPSFDPSKDPSGRFDSLHFSVNYIPSDGSGGQPIATSFSQGYSTTSTQGQGAKHTYTTGFEISATTSLFSSILSGTLKSSKSWSTSDQWSRSGSTTSTTSANFTIYSPLSGDHYVGPTIMTLWKDNVYGSFAFYPVVQSRLRALSIPAPSQPPKR